jgi:hypothetical protein
MASVLEKSPLYFAPVSARVLCDDKQTCVRIGGKMVTTPQSAGGQLRLRIGSFVEANLYGRLAGIDLLPYAPSIKKAALHG